MILGRALACILLSACAKPAGVLAQDNPSAVVNAVPVRASEKQEQTRVASTGPVVPGAGAPAEEKSTAPLRFEPNAAAPLNFTTLAGVPTGNEDGPASVARFSNEIPGIAVDAVGNVYVSDSANEAIRKIAPDGSVVTLAGNGRPEPPDGPEFSWPMGGVAVDTAGVVYVAEPGPGRIRKVTASGFVSTFAGGSAPGYVDGPSTVARFSWPSAVTVGSSGAVYVSESSNHRIRKIAPDGTVSTLAGTGVAGFADGPGQTAQFKGPWGLGVDSDGNLYVADTGNLRIRKITPEGLVSTVAGSGQWGFADGPGAAARFAGPIGLVVDPLKNVFVADQWNNRIRRVSPDGTVSTVAGSGDPGYLDGPASMAQFSQPTAVGLDAAGNLYVAEGSNSRIRKISGGVVSTLAGSGPAPGIGSVDGPKTVARFLGPAGIAVGSSGDAYVADSSSARLRKVTADGTVTTVAGTQPGYQDGPGGTAQFRRPTGVTVSGAAALYVADQGDHRIRKISPDGTVTTLAGTGTAGYRDGGGSNAQFSSPTGVALDKAGNVLVADRDNNRIRMIAPDGTVATFAGSGETGLLDGPVATARFKSPAAIAVDGDGRVWVADQGNNAVRKIAAGMVTTVAGSAGPFEAPGGLAVDGAGGVYVAETRSHLIRKVTPDGNVTVVGGAGTRGGNDGFGTAARFRMPQGVAVRADGTLLVADTGNNAVRTGRPATLSEIARIDTTGGPTGQARLLGTDGSGATAWNWQATRRPVGSVAQLSAPSSRTPTFSPDVPGSYVFRLTASNASAQCITEVSLAAGTAYPDMFSVPTDISRVPYPDFYRQLVPRTLYLEDPYCQVTQDTVAYPASYLDTSRLPDVVGAPFPPSVKRCVSLKDFWISQLAPFSTCGKLTPAPSMREAFVSTLVRVKALGADWVGPVQTFTVTSGSNPVVSIQEGLGISAEEDLAFIAVEAKKAGLKVIIRMLLASPDIPSAPTREWFSRFMDSFVQLQTSQARLYQKYGIDGFQLTWELWYPNLNSLVDVLDTRLLGAVREIRGFYDGMITGTTNYLGDPGEFYSVVDMITCGNGYPLWPLAPGSFTMQDLRDGYRKVVNNWAQMYRRFGKPFFLEVWPQSHPSWPFTGWIEEGYCLPGCPQLSVQTDFASQAMATEALFEEIVAADAKGLMHLGAVESEAYWYSDPVMPSAAIYGYGSFPNISQTIRNKPAESIVYQWFKRPVSVVVPVILSAAGASPGSFFTSEMTLTNRGTADATITYTYTAAAGGSNGTAKDTLPAGRQKVVKDAIEYLRGLGIPVGDSGGRVGTLRVEFGGLSSDDAGAVTVRTGSPVSEGRAGLAYSGLRSSELLSAPVYLCGLRQNTFDRSNVAVINAGDSSAGDIALRLTVISGTPGSPLTQALPDITLPPGGFQQITGILASNGLSLANGFVKVERVSGTAPFYTYGVINDQANSDGSFVEPVAASASAVSGLTLPALVETSSFSSELVVTNLTSRARTLRCEYVASALTGGRASFTLSLVPYEQQILPTFVQVLRERGVVKDAPGPAFAGALFVADSAGDISGIAVGSRTLTPGGGGQYGVYSSAVPSESEAKSTAWLFGLQQDSETRTNLSIVNASPAGSPAGLFRIDLFDGATGQKAGTVENVSVPAQGFTQIGMILAQYAPAASNGYALVTRTSGAGPFVAYAVLNDGAGPGQRSGDGAFVKAFVPGGP